jgi:hypothetical protein
LGTLSTPRGIFFPERRSRDAPIWVAFQSLGQGARLPSSGRLCCLGPGFALVKYIPTNSRPIRTFVIHECPFHPLHPSMAVQKLGRAATSLGFFFPGTCLGTVNIHLISLALSQSLGQFGTAFGTVVCFRGIFCFCSAYQANNRTTLRCVILFCCTGISRFFIITITAVT